MSLPFVCPLDHVMLVHELEGLGIGYREHSFLANRRRFLSRTQPISDSDGGVALDASRQLSATQPISGVALDVDRQLSATQPITGVALDVGRQLSATQPISSIDDGVNP